jgi:glutathione S-transferase
LNLSLAVDAEFLSPYAMSAFVALHETALRFELVTVDLARNAQHDPAYAAASLTGKVPMLVHDGFSLSESSAIAEYLDEVFPERPIYPRDRRQRARARQVQAWLRSDLMPVRQERSTEVVFRAPVSRPLSAEAAKAADKLFFIADRLLPDGAPNLFGTWSIADLDLTLMLNRLVMNGDPVPERLADYAREQWCRSAAQLWVKLDRPAHS